MALTSLPNVTLHRSSLSNAARVAQLNFDFLDATHATTSTPMPKMAPYPRSISNFFKVAEANLALIDATTGFGYLKLGNVTNYRNSINRALRRLGFSMAVAEAGVPAAASPPVQISAMPTHAFTTAAETYDFSQHFTGATSYTITAYPADKFSWDGATGIMTYDTDDASGSFNPLITATNANGSTVSDTTADLSYS